MSNWLVNLNISLRKHTTRWIRRTQFVYQYVQGNVTLEHGWRPMEIPKMRDTWKDFCKQNFSFKIHCVHNHCFQLMVILCFLYKLFFRYSRKFELYVKNFSLPRFHLEEQDLNSRILGLVALLCEKLFVEGSASKLFAVLQETICLHI